MKRTIIIIVMLAAFALTLKEVEVKEVGFQPELDLREVLK
jgi:hypothetical protein